MAKKTDINITESETSLKNLLRTSKDFQQQQRIRFLLMLKQESKIKRTLLANQLCIGYTTLKRWINQYNKEGIDSFLSVNKGGGSSCKIPETIQSILKEKVHNSTTPLKGYRHAQRFLSSEFNYHMPYQTLRCYLIRTYNTKLKAPRKSHYKKEEQAIEAFKKTP